MEQRERPPEERVLVVDEMQAMIESVPQLEVEEAAQEPPQTDVADGNAA